MLDVYVSADVLAAESAVQLLNGSQLANRAIKVRCCWMVCVWMTMCSLQSDTLFEWGYRLVVHIAVARTLAI